MDSNASIDGKLAHLTNILNLRTQGLYTLCLISGNALANHGSHHYTRSTRKCNGTVSGSVLNVGLFAISPGSVFESCC